jgi:hypothetical protein
MEYKLEKIYAWIKWGLAIILVDGIMRLLCILFYPLSYALRVPVRKWHYGSNKAKFCLSLPLWCLLNDGESNDIGYDWFWDAWNIYPTSNWNRFKLAYLWNPLRNPCWNIYTYIHPKVGKITDIDVITNTAMVWKGSKGFISADPLNSCVLKWLNEEGEASNNMGVQIDYDKSILGKIFTYYRVDGVLSFTYSKAWVGDDIGLAREVQLGSTGATIGSRFKIRNKLKTV